MKLQFASGHNNSGNLADFPHAPRITQDIDFAIKYSANGVASATASGLMQVQWDYLEYDELITLLEFFGTTHRAPSVRGTFLLPDWYQIPSIWNGQITLPPPRRGPGIYERVVADISGLEYL